MTALGKLISTALENLRDAALAGYTTVDCAPRPIPTAVLHHDGPAPVIDCGDLLVVQATGVTSSFQGPPEACALVAQISLAVTVTRCIVNLDTWGRVAEGLDLSADAELLAADASTLWAGVTGACAAGTLWADFLELGCADTTFRDMRPGASGGIGWWTWQIGLSASAALL